MIVFDLIAYILAALIVASCVSNLVSDTFPVSERVTWAAVAIAGTTAIIAKIIEAIA